MRYIKMILLGLYLLVDQYALCQEITPENCDNVFYSNNITVYVVYHQVILDSGNYCERDYTYPEIITSDSSLQFMLDSFIKTDLEVEDCSEIDDNDTLLNNSTESHSTLLQIDCITDSIISLSLSIGSYYRGAPHGSSTTEKTIYKIFTGEPIDETDFFKQDSISQNILDQMTIRNDDENPDRKNEFLESRQFFLDCESVVVFYDLYTVYSYAAGLTYIDLEYEDVKSILKADSPLINYFRYVSPGANIKHR